MSTMDRSGLRPFLRTRRRRKPKHLTPQQEFVIACQLMNEVAPKDIAYQWGISESYISRIKSEHFDVIVKWKPEIIERYGASQEAQESFDFGKVLPYRRSK